MPRLEVIIVKVNLHWPNGLFFAISPNDALWNIHHQPGDVSMESRVFLKSFLWTAIISRDSLIYLLNNRLFFILPDSFSLFLYERETNIFTKIVACYFDIVTRKSYWFQNNIATNILGDTENRTWLIKYCDFVTWFLFETTNNQCWLILSCPLNYDQSNEHQFIFKNPYWKLVRNFWKLKVRLRLQKDFDPILTRCELTTAWAPLSRLEKFKVIEVLQKNKVPLTSSPELLIISWWVVEKIAQAAAQDWIYKDCIWRRKRRWSRWLSRF